MGEKQSEEKLRDEIWEKEEKHLENEGQKNCGASVSQFISVRPQTHVPPLTSDFSEHSIE